MIQITDNQSEVFDIIDDQDHVIGQATRRQVHQDPSLIHRSVYIAVYNTKGEILLQQRSATKDTDPLKWTLSCSGHVNAGDEYEQTAHRELKEELGVDMNIEYVAKFLGTYPHETEMSTLYKAVHNGPFTFNEEEIIQLRFFVPDELKKAIVKGTILLSSGGVLALNHL